MSGTVLVTGGAGYIGSHACKALAAAGFLPVVFDDLSRGHRRLVRWGPLEQGDIRDHERLVAVLKQHTPVAVMHFAALTFVGESVADPEPYYSVNVGGTLNLLAAMRETGLDRLVFSSTCAIYGDPVRVPLDEDHPQNPVNPYGLTKYLAERALADYGRAYGLRSVALRYFNAAGADPTGETGEDHDPESHAIPLAIMAAQGRIPQFTVFGDDYATPDGTAVRDYVHVTDLAEAHVAALRHLLAGGASDRINLGNGNGCSVLQLIRAVEQVVGKPVPVAKGARRRGDAAVLIADNGRAGRLLGWSPRITAIEEIVATAWRWHAAQG